MTARRLKITTPERLPDDAPEGLRAKWWRERVARLSRPALAERIGWSAAGIVALERAVEVPTRYRLACAALTHGLGGWAWSPPATREAAQLLRQAAALLDDEPAPGA